MGTPPVPEPASPLTDAEQNSQEIEGNSSEINSKFSNERLLESSARLSLATFGGAVVGLALERRSGTSGNRSGFAQWRRHGPPLPLRNANLPSLTKSWSLSCMLFAFIMESCRLSSPTTVLYNALTKNDSENQATDISFDDQVRQTGFASLGDYTLGGIVAGLAGALSKRSPPELSAEARLQLPSTILKSGRRPLVAWGLTMGLGLGLLAGTFQAAVDVGSLYLERESARQTTETEED